MSLSDFEEFLEDGDYNRLKLISEETKLIKDRIRDELISEEIKRVEWREFGVVGKFRSVNRYDYNHIALNEYLFNLGILPVLSSIMEICLTEQEKQTILEAKKVDRGDRVYFIPTKLTKLGLYGAQDNFVAAESYCPKADGIACPRIDKYNDRITVKEKDASIKRVPVDAGSPETSSHKKSTWSLYQIMSCLRRSPAFFVRCVEVVPCPCCGEELKVIGSRKRISRNATGEVKVLSLRRLRCTGCCKIHHELPDCLVPYKRYESTCVEDVVSEDANKVVVAADDSTLYRWRSWYNVLAAYWRVALTAIKFRFHHEPMEVSSIPSLSTHQRLGHIVGDAPGWLARIVRPLANVNLWLHTRSAFLSTDAFGRLSS